MFSDLFLVLLSEILRVFTFVVDYANNSLVIRERTLIPFLYITRL